MLTLCSPLFFYTALVAVFLLPFGLTYWEFTRDRHKGSDDLDRSAWLLIILSIAALASIGVFILYIFFHSVGC